MATQTQAVPKPPSEKRTVALEPGRKMLVVVSNDSEVAKFRLAGEDRYQFANVGDVKRMVELPGKNFDHVMMNGKLPTEVQQLILTLADRAKVKTVYVTEDGACLIQMMEVFPKGVRGVARFEIPGVIRMVPFGLAAVLNSEDETFDNRPVNSAAAVEAPILNSTPAFAGAKELQAAIQQARSLQEQIVNLATDVAHENDRLRDVVEEKNARIESLETELKKLRAAAKTARELLGNLESEK